MIEGNWRHALSTFSTPTGKWRDDDVGRFYADFCRDRLFATKIRHDGVKVAKFGYDVMASSPEYYLKVGKQGGIVVFVGFIMYSTVL